MALWRSLMQAFRRSVWQGGGNAATAGGQEADGPIGMGVVVSVVLFSSVARTPGQKPPAGGTTPPLDNEALGARLLDMAEWARQAGSTEHADRLLQAAWSLYDDRRGSPRVPIFRSGVAVAGGHAHKIICVNMSQTGALLKCQSPLPDSGNITLKLRGLPSLPAVVLQGGKRARIRFACLSPVARSALDAFLGARMQSPQFIPKMLRGI